MKLRGEKRSRTASNGDSQSQSPEARGGQTSPMLPSHSQQSSADDDHHPANAQPTATVGGDDADSDRPIKYAKVSDNDDSVATDEEEDELASAADGDALPPSPATRPDQLDEPDSSQVATPERDATPTASQFLEYSATRPSRVANRGKKQKGWHFRKENRSLQQAIVKGSPARSERQGSVDTQDHHPGVFKRLPGRRRAPHTDPKIEAAMRRQLDLKVGYRQVAKALKPILSELSQRTADSLESDETYHEQFPEHEQIRAQLDEHLQTQLAVLDAERKYELERLERVREADEYILAQRFEAQLDDAYEEYSLRIKRQMLEILRLAEEEQDENATDDEAGPVHGRFSQNSVTGHRIPMDADHGSRSWGPVCTGQAWSYANDRAGFVSAQKEHDPASVVSAPKDVAWYDAEERAEARAGVSIITMLDAGARIEADAISEKRRAAKESEARLQILASASELAPQPIPAPVKVEAATPTSSLTKEKTRNNALSISHLVSSDSTTSNDPAKGPAQPTWNQPPAYNMQPPSFASRPQPALSDQRHRTEAEPIREALPPQRPTSEYPPHPLGDRRSEYPSLAHISEAQPPPNRYGYPQYSYPPRYEHEYPRPHEQYQSFDQPPYPPTDASHRPPYPDGSYSMDRRGPSVALPHHDPYEHERSRYRPGEQSQTHDHVRQNISGPVVPSGPYGQLQTPRMSTSTMASPEYRNEPPQRLAPAAASPRVMFDPARPDRPIHPREQPAPTQYERLASQPIDIRSWHGSANEQRPEDSERWRAIPYQVSEGPHYSALPRHLEPGQPDYRLPQYRQFASYTSGSGERPLSQQDVPTVAPKQKRREVRRSEGEKQKPDGLSFRQYHPQGPKQPAPDDRHVQIQPATPSAHHTSPGYTAAQPVSQPGYLAPGFDTPPNPSMNMQRHPGQRIGQQLLPATLDPSRSQTQSSHSSPNTAPGHQRQRSSVSGHHEAAERPYGPSSGSPPVETGTGPPASYSGGPGQPSTWPGFESQYPPPGPLTQQGMTGKLYPTGGRRRPPVIPPEGPPPAPPVIHFWQSEPAGGRPPTFIHTGQNGEQPTTKNLDGRYWRNRRRQSPAP